MWRAIRQRVELVVAMCLFVVFKFYLACILKFDCGLPWKQAWRQAGEFKD